jgi:hypothetical protein
MNWKKAVDQLNAKHYAFPPGWDDRDTIAAQLECSPDRVDTLLAPGLKSGEIEKAQHPVWDQRLQRKVLVWGYRQRAQAAPAAQPTAKPTTKPTGDPIVAAVRRSAARHPDYSASKIKDNLPKSMRRLITTAEIKAILGR